MAEVEEVENRELCVGVSNVLPSAVNEVAEKGGGGGEREEKMVYTGKLWGGKPHGRGELRYKNSVFDCEFWMGVPHGSGRHEYRTEREGRCVYEGLFRMGWYHGMGRLSMGKTGEVMEGMFCNGLFHGVGTMRNGVTKLSIVGEFRNNVPHGRCTVEYASTDVRKMYVGEVRNGVPHGGYGKLVYRSGKVVEGDWWNGQCARPAVSEEKEKDEGERKG